MVFVMNSLGKSLSEKCRALLCNYYRFWYKRGPKRGQEISNFCVSVHIYCLSLL